MDVNYSQEMQTNKQIQNSEKRVICVLTTINDVEKPHLQTLVNQLI